MRMISTILFDNDGVLVDTERVFYESNRHMLEEFGVKLNETEFSKLSLSKGMSLADIIVSLGNTPETAEEARRRRNAVYDRMLLERGVSLVVPHAPEVLAELHRNCRIGVVTCCQKMHFKTIHDASGLRPFFDFVVGYGDFERHKPYPDPYLTALGRAGIAPDEAIAVEDSERGVLSAVRAGIRVAAIPRGISLCGDFSAATWRLQDIRELPALLDSLQPRNENSQPQ